MNYIEKQRRKAARHDAGGDAPLAFASFVFAHAACGEEVIESRLGEGIVACHCLRCNEMGIFDSTSSAYRETCRGPRRASGRSPVQG